MIILYILFLAFKTGYLSIWLNFQFTWFIRYSIEPSEFKVNSVSNDQIQEKSLHINDLPIEVLVLMFSFFNIDEIGSVEKGNFQKPKIIQKRN